MSNEVPGTPRQQWYDRANIVGTRDRFPADGALYNICTQTGEEFSVEFLRDRVVSPRTAPVMRDVYHQQAKRFGHNRHMPYEDLNGVLGLQRMSSENGSDVIDFVPGIGYVAEAEKRSYPVNIIGHQRERGGASGQLSSKFADDGWFSPGRGSPPIHTVELPRSCQCSGRVLSSSPSECSSSGKIKFLCSFGGKILPRPHDGKLRYVGGETRILSLSRSISFEDLTRKTCAIWNHHHTIKYQLPGEDLDALISVCSNEDLNLMIEEYQELERTEGSQRLRIFLISTSEPGSPASIEHRVSQPIDADLQYVVAVNGMLSSPRKSSCGHSLTSQTSQFGNASDCSPSFRRETPTAAYFPHMSSPFQLSGKSFNQPPPFSPVSIQQRDSKNITSPLYVNQSPHDCNKSSYPIVLENVSNENLSLMENTKSIHTVGHFNINNLTQGTSFMNYHPSNPYFAELDQNNQPFDMSYQNTSLSSEVTSSACGQFDLISESSITKDWPFHSDIPEEQSILLSESSDRDKFCSKMERSLADSLWKENDERSSSHGNGKGLTESSLNIWRPKSPPSTMSSTSPDWLLQFLQTADVKAQEDLHENLPTCITTDNRIGEFHQDGGNMNLTDEKKHWSDESGGNFRIFLEEINDVQNNYLPSDIHPLFTEIERPERKVSIPLEFPEESPRILMEQSHCFQLEMGNSDITIKRQNSTEDIGNARSETASSHQFSPRRTDCRPVAFNNSQEQSLPVSEAVSYATEREDSYRNEKTSTYGKSYDANGCDILCVRSLAIEPRQENDITSTVPSSLKVISRDDYDVDTEPPYSEQVDVDCITANLESDAANGTGKEIDRPFGDSELVEIEAGIYGLQIIKNADLEELQELGSGTFGTVYHGKWRGTDVAIKRIKSSCFSGKSSEQERLVKDFWREARLLSTLHHPNVVAFYGIVPDGPGGTLATVTEYMVNGSLRTVLLTKKVVLDRRKRLMIAMDAAFGMEYLHMKNIVHFDLKCDNLLVNLRDAERPICKVGDFDLSKIKHNTLVSGGVRGTLPWMAPELLNGNSSMVSEKVDVFSFGITMWEILTGEEPYANLHCGAIIGGIVNNTLRPSIPKRCDAEWKKLMEDCWSADPSARPSFTEITNRLRNMSAALKKKSPNIAIR